MVDVEEGLKTLEQKLKQAEIEKVLEEARRQCREFVQLPIAPSGRNEEGEQPPRRVSPSPLRPINRRTLADTRWQFWCIPGFRGTALRFSHSA